MDYYNAIIISNISTEYEGCRESTDENNVTLSPPRSF